MMLKLVKPAPAASPALGLTMGGAPPVRVSAAPGLTYAQAFAGAPVHSAPQRPALRLVARDGLSVEG